MTLIANALGTPPADMIEHIHAEGRKVAALCGSPYQARKHADAGVDIIIAQGGEGGGHCGEVGSIVLWPQVVKAVAPVPVLAAGGIGSGAADRRGARARLPGRVVGFAVADGRGVREHPGAAGRLREGEQSATPCAAVRSPASRAACCATTGPRRGRPRATRSRSACRCSTWCPGMAVAATHRYPDQSRRRRVQPGRSGRRSVREGREDRRGHPALGRGVPRGDVCARRAQRGGLQLSPA